VKRRPFKRPAPETVRIGEMEFQIPAGTSKARRREFIAAAEQHVIERGEISVADATKRAIRETDQRDGTKYSRRPRDMARMAWCKHLPCTLARPGAPFAEFWHGPADVDGCRGPIEAHHAGEHAGWQKAPDDTVLPLCDHHHDCLTDRRGVFAGWPKFSLKRWELAAVESYQRAYQDHLATAEAPPDA
jgi:hypothetical protein